MTFWRSFLAASACILVACTGGGGGSPTPPSPPVNIPPTVSAGADQAVDEGRIVTLNGTVSDPDSTPSLAWTQTAGTSVTLSGEASLSPSFDAPTVSADEVLTFRLTANDGANSPVSDLVDITVRDTGTMSFTLDPQLTDAAISAGAPHLISPMSGPGPGTDKLFVWLPGTGGTPENNSLIINHASTRGYHSIGLSYSNSIAVINICAFGIGAGDLDCPADMRAEILTGTDTSPYIAVTRTNSIENRLDRLLAYLDTSDPSAGWGDFLVAGTTYWQNIAVAGHSQGGGHAAFISKRQSVDRALLFSSTEAANWTLDAGMTVGTRLYAFANENEQFWPGISNSWTNLDIPGPLTNIDTAVPTPPGAQQLFTSRTECNGGTDTSALHGCVVTDRHTPRDVNGDPLFGPVWDYMLGVD